MGPLAGRGLEIVRPGGGAVTLLLLRDAAGACHGFGTRCGEAGARGASAGPRAVLARAAAGAARRLGLSGDGVHGCCEPSSRGPCVYRNGVQAEC